MMKNKTGLIAILATGIIIVLIVAISNFNIEVNINSKGDKVSTNQQTTQAVQGSQDNSMADHHGESVPAEATVFNDLVGKPAPDFTLETDDGSKITLSSLKGKNVILFFNEGLMCYPACWNQVAAFGKDAQFKDKNTVVLNITVDPKKDWQEAVGKMPELATATVLLDTDKKVSTVYGVLSLPSSMHKGQFPGHSYVIIDKEGIVKFARDDVQMAVRNQELAVEIDKL